MTTTPKPEPASDIEEEIRATKARCPACRLDFNVNVIFQRTREGAIAAYRTRHDSDRARIRELEAENKQLKSRLSTIDN